MIIKLLSTVAAASLAVPIWAAPGHDMGAVGEDLGADDATGTQAQAAAAQDPAPAIPSTDRLPEGASPFAD